MSHPFVSKPIRRTSLWRLGHGLAATLCAALAPTQTPPAQTHPAARPTPAAPGTDANPRDGERIVRELTEVLQIPAGSDDIRTAAPRLGEFLERHRGQDLARLGYAPALYLFMHGDYEAAMRDLDAYFARYARLPVAAHAPLVGRVYLDAITEEAAQATPDPLRVQGFALRALDLRQPPVTVGNRVQTALLHCGIGVDVASVRTALVRRLQADQALGDSERDRALRALFGEPVTEPTQLDAAKIQVVWRARTLGGQTVDLADLRGRTVLLHFWASWCPITAAEAPALVAAYERFHTQGFEIVGVALDASDDDTVRDAAKHLGFGWAQVHDGDLDGPLAQHFGVETLPYALLLDRDGVVRARGEQARGPALAARLEQLTATAERGSKR